MSRRPAQPLAPLDLSWYVEQGEKIHAGVELTRRLRNEMRVKWDPGHVYVIQFGSGLVKVGKTGSPEQRMRSHARWAEIYGDSIETTWISARHPKHSETERLLISLCKAHGHPVSREYFRDLPFDVAVGFAELTVETVEDRVALADRIKKDQERRVYLDALVAAVDGDLSRTWQDAHVAAFGATVEQATS